MGERREHGWYIIGDLMLNGTDQTKISKNQPVKVRPVPSGKIQIF